MRRFSSPPPRKPWRWLLGLAGALLLVGLLPALMLAQWGPYILGRVLSAYLQTSVSVQGVVGGWWDGVTLQQLSVAVDRTPQAPTLVRVEQLTVNRPVVALLFSAKPLALHLDGIHFDLRRGDDGQWNLTPLLKVFGTDTSTQPHARAIVPQLDRQITVTVTHGTLRVGEEAEFTDLAIGLHLAEGGVTITQAQANIASGTIALQGDVSLHELTSDKALHWRLAGIHLDWLLGPAFQAVTIAEANGRLTNQDDGFVLETAVQVPSFAMAPGTLGQRQPHLTRVASTCTLQLRPPFTRLTTEACRLHTAEAQLSLRSSTVDLVPDPQLTLQVDGSLAGSLVGALAPEVPGQFPDPVHVDGQITVPLRSGVWQAMGWRLAVSSERFVFDDTFTEVYSTVVKSDDQIEITDMRARRGPGRIRGAGAWRLAEPVDGSFQVEMEHISLRQSLAQGAAGGPYLLDGMVSGAVTWHMGHDGQHLTVDVRTHPLHLRHAATTVVMIPQGRVHGGLGRHRDGTWWEDALALVSDDLTITLHRGQVCLSPPEEARFEVHAALEAEGAWLTSLLATAGVGGLVLSGRSEVTLQAAGSPAHPLGTIVGRGSVQTAEGSFYTQAFSRMEVTYELTPGRVRIAQGGVRFEAGTLMVHGSLGFLRPFSDSDDEISLRLHQMPAPFTGQEPRTMAPITLLDGEVTARGTASGQVRVGINLQVPKTPFQLAPADQALTRVELPAIQVASEVLTAPPWTHWQADTVHIQGDGLTVELGDVVAHRTPAHYDLSGAVHLQAATEVIRGSIGGLLPERLRARWTTMYTAISSIVSCSAK
jgi:hypothetical protein